MTVEIIKLDMFVLEMSNGDGVSSTVEAYTRDEKVGRDYKIQTKNYGSYRPFKQTFVIVSSLAELDAAKKEKVKERALSKLSREEKEALGLL